VVFAVAGAMALLAALLLSRVKAPSQAWMEE
jgi:hypothetical protein